MVKTSKLSRLDSSCPDSYLDNLSESLHHLRVYIGVKINKQTNKKKPLPLITQVAFKETKQTS